jgi:hypothetical protein
VSRNICLEKQAGDAVGGKGAGSVAALLRDQIIFRPAHQPERHFEALIRQTSPARLFFKMYSLIDNGLKSGIFFKVGVLLISGRSKYPDNPKIRPSNTEGFN